MLRRAWERFAPFIKKAFPETADHCGLIESPLTEIEKMRAWLAENENAQLVGKLFLKRDSDLPVAGSVKARGGCYAVLKHTEELALANHLIKPNEDYSVFASRAFRSFFSRYELQSARPAIWGLSIGIMGRSAWLQGHCSHERRRAAVEERPAAQKGRNGHRVRRGLFLRSAKGQGTRSGGSDALFYRR